MGLCNGAGSRPFTSTSHTEGKKLIKKEITYDGVDGPITEEFYFSLSMAELMEQMLESVGDVRGDIGSQLQAIVDSGDAKLILSTFKRIVLQAVGKRDGQKFLKNQAIRDDFEGSGAYSELFYEMITNAGFAAQFIAGMLPANAQEKIEKVKAAGMVSLPIVEQRQVEEDERPVWLKEGRDPTEHELHRMSPAEMKMAFRERLTRS